MTDDLLPPELAADAPPLTDTELDELFRWADDTADEHHQPWRDVLADCSPTPEVVTPHLSVLIRWRIEDDEAAEWAGRKMATAAENVKRAGEQRDAWVARITDWYDEVTKRDRYTVVAMEARLEDYGARVRAAGGPATLTLPSVTIKSTVTNPKAEVDDDEAVAVYIEAALSNDQGEPDKAAWMGALDGAGLDMRDLVKREAKVYVQPLRSLVQLGEVDDGQRAVVTLSCDHVVDMPVTGLDDLAIPSPGELGPCTVCPADPIDGPPQVHVTHVEVVEVKRPAVLGPDGREVPGTVVNPGGVTVKAKPRG